MTSKPLNCRRAITLHRPVREGYVFLELVRTIKRMDQAYGILILYEVGLLIILSSAASELFKRLRLPGLIGAILVGVFIGGPGGVGLVTDLTVISILGTLGSVLILFTIGLEFDASAFWKAGKGAFLVTTFGMAASVFLGYLVGWAMGWPDMASFLLGVVIAPSGTSAIAVLLSSEGKVESRTGSTLITACVIDDVEGVILLTIALGVAAQGALRPAEIAKIGSVSVLFILGTIYAGGRLLPTLISRSEKILSDEGLFAVLLGLGMILAFAASKIGLAAITGAFIMGAIIPYRKIGEKIAHRLLLTKEIFAAIFFTSIGLSIDPTSIAGILPTAALLIVIAISARLIGGAAGAALSGFRGKALTTVIVGLAIRAEMSLIIARESASAGIVGSDFITLTATVVIGSMTISLPLLTRLVRSIP
ncbi:MAG: cation:proton antiporter [Candidatus Bathyarchaeia archaeon]